METIRRGVYERVGSFELHTLLGRGGGGEVWAGVQLPGGAEVVLKRPVSNAAAAVDRLDREIAHALRLQHPHVVQVVEARRARAGALPYLVLERAQRGSLSRQSLDGHPQALLQALLDALAGLEHLHDRGLLHLDVKPGNLFVREGKEGVRVQVGDLGSALEQHALKNTGGRALAGTIGYLAPEHRAGDLAGFGPWTDLWSLGATARALAGDELPAWLLPWVERCTAPAPGDRFASAERAAEALRALAVYPSREALDRATQRPRGIFSLLGLAGTSRAG